MAQYVLGFRWECNSMECKLAEWQPFLTLLPEKVMVRYAIPSFADTKALKKSFLLHIWSSLQECGFSTHTSKPLLKWTISKFMKPYQHHLSPEFNKALSVLLSSMNNSHEFQETICDISMIVCVKEICTLSKTHSLQKTYLLLVIGGGTRRNPGKPSVFMEDKWLSLNSLRGSIIQTTGQFRVTSCGSSASTWEMVAYSIACGAKRVLLILQRVISKPTVTKK